MISHRRSLRSGRPLRPTLRKVPHPPIVILFNLLNIIPLQREFIASQLIKALKPLEADEGIYLYLLTNDGQLYFVGGAHKSFQAAAIAQGSIGGESSSRATTDDALPWTTNSAATGSSDRQSPWI
jgi:hypothetical protein